MDKEVKIVSGLFADVGRELNWFEKKYYRALRAFSETKYWLKGVVQWLKYGFPLYQSWNFYGWHADMVLPRLRHLRNNLNGHPSLINSIEEWREILDKMIWSFENCEEIPHPVYSDDFDHRYKVTEENGMKSYISMNETGTVDWTPLKEHSERVQEGLGLFAKYYTNLWD